MDRPCKLANGIIFNANRVFESSDINIQLWTQLLGSHNENEKLAADADWSM